METIITILVCIILFFLLVSIVGYFYFMYTAFRIKREAEKFINRKINKKNK